MTPAIRFGKLVPGLRRTRRAAAEGCVVTSLRRWFCCGGQRSRLICAGGHEVAPLHGQPVQPRTGSRLLTGCRARSAWWRWTGRGMGPAARPPAASRSTLAPWWRNWTHAASGGRCWWATPTGEASRCGRARQLANLGPRTPRSRTAMAQLPDRTARAGRRTRRPDRFPGRCQAAGPAARRPARHAHPGHTTHQLAAVLPDARVQLVHQTGHHLPRRGARQIATATCDLQRSRPASARS